MPSYAASSDTQLKCMSLPHAVAAIHELVPSSRIAPVMLILQAGTYTVTYSAADKAGNVGTASRSVVVSSPCVSPNFFCPATCRSAAIAVVLCLPGARRPCDEGGCEMRGVVVAEAICTCLRW